jgi:hypothetical protein
VPLFRVPPKTASRCESHGRRKHQLAARMVGVCLPCWTIILIGFVSPRLPSLSLPTRKEFDVGSHTAGFDNWVLLVGLSRMLGLPTAHVVHLAAARGKGASMLSACAKQ